MKNVIGRGTIEEGQLISKMKEYIKRKPPREREVIGQGEES